MSEMIFFEVKMEVDYHCLQRDFQFILIKISQLVVRCMPNKRTLQAHCAV